MSEPQQFGVCGQCRYWMPDRDSWKKAESGDRGAAAGKCCAAPPVTVVVQGEPKQFRPWVRMDDLGCVLFRPMGRAFDEIPPHANAPAGN